MYLLSIEQYKIVKRNFTENNDDSEDFIIKVMNATLDRIRSRCDQNGQDFYELTGILDINSLVGYSFCVMGKSGCVFTQDR